VPEVLECNSGWRWTGQHRTPLAEDVVAPDVSDASCESLYAIVVTANCICAVDSTPTATTRQRFKSRMNPTWPDPPSCLVRHRDAPAYAGIHYLRQKRSPKNLVFGRISAVSRTWQRKFELCCCHLSMSSCFVRWIQKKTRSIKEKLARWHPARPTGHETIMARNRSCSGQEQNGVDVWRGLNQHQG